MTSAVTFVSVVIIFTTIIEAYNVTSFRIEDDKPVLATAYKLPEERRKMSLFPNIAVKKLTVDLVPLRRNRTNAVIVKKKPLMPKILVSENVRDIKQVNIKTSTSPKNSKLYSFKKSSPKIVIDDKTKIKDSSFLINDNTGSIKLEANSEYLKLKGNYRAIEALFVTENPVNNEDPNFILNNINEVTTDVTIDSNMNNFKSNHLQKKSTFREMKHRKNDSVFELGGKADKNSYSAEEVEDRKEFIFIESNEKKPEQKVTKPVENTISGTKFLRDGYFRPKRSNNVIEEENSASTVSVFTFTGRESPVSNNLMFKNINM